MVLLEAWKVVVTERYAQFDGRAGRAEFWWYFLASFIISAILGILAQTSGIFNVISASTGWPCSSPDWPSPSGGCTTPTAAAGGC